MWLPLLSDLILFMVIGEALTSSQCMLWLMKFATRSILRSSDTSEKKMKKHVFFDSNSSIVGDRIDDCLLQNWIAQPPYFKIVVTGRNDQCGFPLFISFCPKSKLAEK